jgi:DivIVA domain-containing protein
VVGGESLKPVQTDAEGPPGSPEEDGDSTERPSARGEIGDVSFPVSIRGYDREAVDAYLSRVHQLIAELEVKRSPEAAVKHALERVGDQTKAILAQAGQAAEQITVAARQEAEESTARAQREAEEVVAKANAAAAEILARSKAEAEATTAQAHKEAGEQLQRSQEEVAALRAEAEAQMREIHADTETIQHERSQLLDDIRAITTHVTELIDAATARFPHPQAASDQAEEGKPQSGPTGEAAATEITATDEPTAEAAAPPHSAQ